MKYDFKAPTCDGNCILIIELLLNAMWQKESWINNETDIKLIENIVQNSSSHSRWKLDINK